MKNKSASIIDMSKKSSSTPTPSAAVIPASGSAWERFWLTASDPIALHVLRVLSGLLFLTWLLPLTGHIDAFFSINGLFDSKAFIEASQLPLDRRPVFGWSLLYKLDSSSLAHGVYWTTIGVLTLFTLGFATRIMAVLTWLLMTSYVGFLASATGHGESDLLVVLAFYLMVGYVLLGQFSRPLSPLQRIVGTWDTFLPACFLARNVQKEPVWGSYAANVVVRLFQVHFAMIMVAVFLHKLQIGDWWSGVALYYPLHLPFETTSDMIHAEAPFAGTRLFFYSLATYLVLAWQITFPLWAWRQGFRCRTLLIGGGALAWFGCAWVYRMPVFGPVLFIGCLMFLTPEEWRSLGAAFNGVWQHFTGGFAAKREEKVPMAVRS